MHVKQNPGRLSCSTCAFISHCWVHLVNSHLMSDGGVQVWFEGGYSEYDADLRKRTGGDPTRIKYRKMAMLA